MSEVWILVMYGFVWNSFPDPGLLCLHKDQNGKCEVALVSEHTTGAACASALKKRVEGIKEWPGYSLECRGNLK